MDIRSAGVSPAPLSRRDAGATIGFPRFAGILAALLAVLVFSGCSPTVRYRTLPPSVRSIYFPMIENRTQQPGLEERFTVAAQEEFLADGRLSLVSEKEADAVVNVSLLNFDAEPVAMNSDEYATSKQYLVRASYEIFENIPGRPSIGGRREVETKLYFNADPRSTTFNGEPYEQEALAREFGKMLVLDVLTGQFEETPPGGDEEKPEDSNKSAIPNMGVSL